MQFELKNPSVFLLENSLEDTPSLKHYHIWILTIRKYIKLLHT